MYFIRKQQSILGLNIARGFNLFIFEFVSPPLTPRRRRPPLPAVARARARRGVRATTAGAATGAATGTATGTTATGTTTGTATGCCQKNK